MQNPHSQTAADPRSAFVTGGSGFVGSRLIALLVSRGWQVKALARSPEAMEAVRRAGAIPVQGDLTHASALRSGMEGCEAVFHVAAHFKLWGPRAVFDRINVEGMRMLVDAAAATPGLRRVVTVSAAAVVMGDPEPMLDVDERRPLQTRDFAPYSSSKAEGERLLLAANGCRPGRDHRHPSALYLGSGYANPRSHGRNRAGRALPVGRRWRTGYVHLPC